MQNRHLSVRVGDDIIDALNAMADDRNLELSTMTRNLITAALQVRQRSCPRTHRNGQRCGGCGLLLEPGHALERL